MCEGVRSQEILYLYFVVVLSDVCFVGMVFVPVLCWGVDVSIPRSARSMIGHVSGVQAAAIPVD